jgi:hypothetical protein
MVGGCSCSCLQVPDRAQRAVTRMRRRPRQSLRDVRPRGGVSLTSSSLSRSSCDPVFELLISRLITHPWVSGARPWMQRTVSPTPTSSSSSSLRSTTPGEAIHFVPPSTSVGIFHSRGVDSVLIYQFRCSWTVITAQGNETALCFLWPTNPNCCGSQEWLDDIAYCSLLGHLSFIFLQSNLG